MLAPGHSTRLFLPPVVLFGPTSTRTHSLPPVCRQPNPHRMTCLQNCATQVSWNHILAKKPGGWGSPPAPISPLHPSRGRDVCNASPPPLESRLASSRREKNPFRKCGG